MATSTDARLWIRMICGLAMAIYSLPAIGEEKLGNSNLVSYRESPQYCGVAATMACVHALGIQPELDAEPLDFAPRVTGSSLADLQRLIAELQVPAAVARGLRVDDLIDLKIPAVMHVRSKVSDRAANHWIAFLGVGDTGEILVYDVNRGYHSLSWGEVAASWDGNALLIGESAVNDIGSFLREEWLFALLLLAALLLIRELGKGYSASWYRGGGSLAYISLLGVVALGSILFHALAGVGLLRDLPVAEMVAARGMNESGCVVEFAAVNELRKSAGAVLIDARSNELFVAGTIEPAISLPASADLTFAAQALSGVDKNSKIVVFCGAESCPAADQVARFLFVNGYLEVCVYPGGYEEWIAKSK